MIDLYTVPTANGQRASVMLEEVDLPYNVHVIDFASAGHLAADFLAINPLGMAPAMIDHDGPDGETVNLFLHTWFSDILLSLMAHGLWWESFWTSSVVIVLLVISSSGWENIDVVGSEPVNIWLHTWFSNISLANLVSSGIKRSWEG